MLFNLNPSPTIVVVLCCNVCLYGNAYMCDIALLQDLGGKDIYLRNIYLVCHIIRNSGVYIHVYLCM